MNDFNQLKCWKCNSHRIQTKRMRIGKMRTSPDQIKQGEQDLNIYQQFIVCLDCKYKLSPYQDSYLKKIVYNPSRNKTFTDLGVRFALAKQPTMVYVGLTQHAEILVMLIRSALIEKGLDPELCQLVHGQLEDDKNEQVKSDFASKKVLIAVVTSIWGEGTDIPNLRWVLYAKAGLPGTELEQVLGRALRLAPGKFRAGFIDSLDKFDEKFAAKAQARKKFLEKRGFKVVVLKK